MTRQFEAHLGWEYVLDEEEWQDAGVYLNNVNDLMHQVWMDEEEIVEVVEQSMIDMMQR